MVMIAHYRAALGLSDPFTGSFWLGVDLFFVVSGYVFGRHLDEGVGPLPAYALRRLARILPLYWVVLVLYASASPLGFTAFVPHALMLHTAGSLALAQSYNAAFWSLPVELCFYGTVPLLAALMQKRSKRLVLGLALAVGVGLQALISWQALAGWPSLAADAANHAPDANRWLWLHFQLPGRWLEFVFGFLAYAWVKRQQGVAPGASRCLVMGLKLRFVLGFALGLTAALGCLAWAARIAQVPESAWKMLWLMQLPWLFALCVMPVVAALAYWAQMSFWRGARTKRMTALATFAGALSYGLYLLHNLPPLWLPQAGVWVHAGLSLALAWLLHRVVEAPALSWARSTGARGNKSTAHHREGS